MADETKDTGAAPTRRGRFGRPVAPQDAPASVAARSAPQAAEEPAPVVEPLPPEPEPVPEPLPEPERTARRVTIEPTALRIPPRPKLTEFHVGTRRSCPHQNVTIGGISFPSFTGGALIGENRRQGARVRLSPEQIDRVKRALAGKIVRWTMAGGERRGQLLSVDSPGFAAQAGDEPLAQHVYCYEVPPEQKAAEELEPASMLG